MNRPQPARAAAVADAERVERRLEDIEVKLAFAEDLIERLDAVVVRQQQQIDRLTQELLRLREQATAPQAPAFRSLRDELPPHY